MGGKRETNGRGGDEKNFRYTSGLVRNIPIVYVFKTSDFDKILFFAQPLPGLTSSK